MTGSRSKILEHAVAAGFAVTGVWILHFTGTEFAEAGYASGDALTNAALFPNLIAWALIVLGGLNVLMLLLGRVSQSMEDSEMPASSNELRLRVLGVLGVVALYLMLVKTVGYDLSTPVMLAVILAVLGAKWIEALALGVLISLGLSLVFEQGLNVILPVGRLGLGW